MATIPLSSRRTADRANPEDVLETSAALASVMSQLMTSFEELFGSMTPMVEHLGSMSCGPASNRVVDALQAGYKGFKAAFMDAMSNGPVPVASDDATVQGKSLPSDGVIDNTREPRRALDAMPTNRGLLSKQELETSAARSGQVPGSTSGDDFVNKLSGTRISCQAMPAETTMDQHVLDRSVIFNRLDAPAAAVRSFGGTFDSQDVQRILDELNKQKQPVPTSAH